MSKAVHVSEIEKFVAVGGCSKKRDYIKKSLSLLIS